MTETKMHREFEQDRSRMDLGPSGKILIKIFHDLGRLCALYRSAIEVSTLRLIDPNHPSAHSEGIRIEVKDADDESSTSFLNLEEADGLVTALDYMSSCIAQASSAAAGDYVEMTFSSCDDLSIGFFVSAGKIKAFIKSGRMQAYVESSGLRDLSQLVRKGKLHLTESTLARGAQAGG